MPGLSRLVGEQELPDNYTATANSLHAQLFFHVEQGAQTSAYQHQSYVIPAANIEAFATRNWSTLAISVLGKAFQSERPSDMSSEIELAAGIMIYYKLCVSFQIHHGPVQPARVHLFRKLYDATTRKFDSLDWPSFQMMHQTQPQTVTSRVIKGAFIATLALVADINSLGITVISPFVANPAWHLNFYSWLEMTDANEMIFVPDRPIFAELTETTRTFFPFYFNTYTF